MNKGKVPNFKSQYSIIIVTSFMKHISPEELLQWKTTGKDHQLIDIREIYEVETCTIGGQNIPMADVIERNREIRKDVPVVFHCKSGRRSEAVVHALEQKLGLQNLFTLDGGIIAWIDKVDPSLVRY